MSELPEIKAAWKDHAHAKGFAARMGRRKAQGNQCGEEEANKTWDQAYWDFIQENYEGNVTSWNQFQAAKALHNTLEQYKIKDAFIEYCENNVDFLHKRFCNDNALRVCHLMAVTVTHNFATAMTTQEVSIMLLECLRFCVPMDMDACDTTSSRSDLTTPGYNGRALPWIFDKNEKLTTDNMNALITPMAKSKVYMKAANEDKEMMEEADLAGDGKISFAELTKAITG